VAGDEVPSIDGVCVCLCAQFKPCIIFHVHVVCLSLNCQPAEGKLIFVQCGWMMDGWMPNESKYVNLNQWEVGGWKCRNYEGFLDLLID
jgi:hypothetical protein